VTLALDATVLLNFGRVSAIDLLARLTSEEVVVLDEVFARCFGPTSPSSNSTTPAPKAAFGDTP
jgi:hypothetical protein